MRKQTVSSLISACPHGTTPLPLDGFLWDLIFWYISKILSTGFKFRYNLTRITGTSHEELCTFVIICNWIIFIMRNDSDESCRENQNTHFMFNDFFFPRIVPFMRQCRKILSSRTGHRLQYGAFALRAVHLRLQTHTQNMWYCFSTAVMFKGSRLVVTLCLTLPVLLGLCIANGASCGDMHEFFRPSFVFVHPSLAFVGNWNFRDVCVLQWHNVHTKFRENGSVVLKANRKTHTHTHTHSTVKLL